MTDQPIVLVHGALGHAGQMLELKNTLLTFGHQVHVVELSGHGKTPQKEAFGIEAFAYQLQGYLQQNKLNQCHIFGYSMGGYVALWLAIQKPGILSKITTLATKYDWNPEQAHREAAMLDPDTLLQKAPAYAENLQMAHGDAWRDLLGDTAKMMLELGENPLLGPAVLAEVKIEVNVLVGDLDRMVTQEESQTLAAALPNGRLRVLSGVKHPLEQVPVNVIVEALLH